MATDGGKAYAFKVTGSVILCIQQDGILHKPVWLRTGFDTLTRLFYWVGLKRNVQKTVGMVCHPCRVFGVQADKAYTQRMTGVGWDCK